MKVLLLLTLWCLALIAISACGGSGSTANSSGNSGAGEKDKAAPAKGGLKPADVTPDKVLSVAELVDAATADQSAWRGKEVTVSGYVWEGQGAGENIVTVTNDERSVRTTTVSCGLAGKKPEGLNNKTVVFKGTISYTTGFGESKSVNLSPCELKQ